ncbi:FtsX-like permease family protein [uncultured Acetatifactor sp.]|uniref:ABC transporter permease n=1 Tax=uncultured Acetatifactor sp. TaxID=1671927 RepID=UPI00261F0213|nr:FtsX-like permease family protein [uncultured Acetatifactor sp.]
MKSYLDLVPISAKVHRKQNRMSIICIVLAVFLVTAIFGMADMFIRGQILQAQQENGNWHIGIRSISDEDAKLIASRPEVAAAADYGVFNYRGGQGYTLSGKNVAICGSSESAVTEIFAALDKGSFPANGDEALVTNNAKNMLHLEIGEQIVITMPDGSERAYTISGFMNNTVGIMSRDSYGVCLPTESFRAIYPDGASSNPADYTMRLLQFKSTRNIQSNIAEIKQQFGLSDEQVSENTELLGLLGQSSNSFMLQVYAVAAILFILVLIAGVLMITSSMNSNVAQRTEFFGMVRCIGTTPKQVMRLVRKEALNWCRFAIPLGVAGGIVLIWVLCFILRQLSPEFFGGMPAFSISYPSVIAGIVVGLLTVLLAARSPAKKASKVSPLAAVSGNANDLQPVKKAANTKFFKIETSLGIHHAKASKKNFILMIGSFSVSIILFLAFSVTIDFMNHTLTPLQPWTADISVISPENTCSVKAEYIEELRQNSAVKNAYGRMFAYNVPVIVNGEEKAVDLISYEDMQFDWAKDYLLSGSLEKAQSENNTGLIVFDSENNIEAGNVITLNLNGSQADLEIAGVVSQCPFNNSPGVGKLICSEDTFRKLTGETDYTIIDIQLSKKATENDVRDIHSLVGSQYTFSDERMGNSNTRGAYYCFGLFIYGFLVLIALITLCNIINSIAMSVAAKMKQYGAFRAIGLSNRQLAKMIIAEASAYAVTGIICGSVLGIICNKILFSKLITHHWGDAWSVPLVELGIIIIVVAIAVILAVSNPIRKMKETSIVDTISAS